MEKKTLCFVSQITQRQNYGVRKYAWLYNDYIPDIT